MARPARRNGMKWHHIWRSYVPGSKYKRRKHPGCSCCRPRPVSVARSAAKRAAIEEQI